MIDAKEISKTYYRGNFSLHPISLKINTGDIMGLVGENAVHVQFNGGFYTVTSSNHTSQEILSILLSHNISMTYFRGIIYSTKRLF